MRGDNTFVSRQWYRVLDSLDACVDDVGVTHVMCAEEALKGGVARKLGGFQGRPLGEEITEECGVFVLEPLHDVREVVFERTGVAVGEASCVADQTAAMFDELLERTQRGALRDEWLKLIAMPEQQIELQFRIGGVVLRMTRRKGFTVLGEGSRVDGEQHQERVFT